MHPFRHRPPLTIAALILSAAAVFLSRRPATEGNFSVHSASPSNLSSPVFVHSGPASSGSLDRLLETVPRTSPERVLSAAGLPQPGADKKVEGTLAATRESFAPSVQDTPVPLLNRLSGTPSFGQAAWAGREISVAPGSAGSVLPVDGWQVIVEAAEPLPGAAAPALHVAVIPPASDPGVEAADPEPVVSPEREPVISSRNESGFSPEDELFRAKWGWAAWDAARRAARESMTTAE